MVMVMLRRTHLTIAIAGPRSDATVLLDSTTTGFPSWCFLLRPSCSICTESRGSVDNERDRGHV